MVHMILPMLQATNMVAGIELSSIPVGARFLVIPAKLIFLQEATELLPLNLIPRPPDL